MYVCMWEELNWIQQNVYRKKLKTEERYMFCDSFIVSTCFAFKVLSEYKNILSKLFFLYEE